MSDESVHNLISELCNYHLKDVSQISNKLKFRKKIKSLSYETLFLFQNVKKISNTTLTSYEKLLSHASDLRIKGLVDQAEKLNILLEKIHLVDVSDVGSLFTFLICMFNTGQQGCQVISQAILRSMKLRTSSSSPPSDFRYPDFNDQDFIMPNDSSELSLKEFEKEPFGRYKNYKEFAAFNLQWTDDFDLDHDSDFRKEPSPSASPTPEDVDPWEEAMKMKSSKRIVWEDVGRKNPPRELPYLTESLDATQHLQSSALSFSITSGIPRFEDIADSITNLLLGIPSRLFSFGENSAGEFEHKGLMNCCREFAILGESCRELLRFCDMHSKDYGMLCTSFCEAIQSYLVQYCSTLLSIKYNCSSVGDIHFKYKKFFKQLRYLAQLCQFDNVDLGSSSPPKDASLLSYLYVRCLEVEEDCELRPLLLYIFKWTCAPYFRALEEWIFFGRCNANEGHMIAKLNQDIFVSRDETFWNKCISAADSIPVFLNEAYKTALHCGKSICLLRMCSGETNNPSTVAKHPPLDLMLTMNSLNKYQEMYEVYRKKVLQGSSGKDEMKMSLDSVISMPKEDVNTTVKNIYSGEELSTMDDFHSNDDNVEDTLINVDEESDNNLIEATSGASTSDVDRSPNSLPPQQDVPNRPVEQLFAEINNKLDNNFDKTSSNHLTPSQIMSTPGYIPHKKQIEGASITRESKEDDFTHKPHIRVNISYAGTPRPDRPHIKSVHGAHPSMVSKEFPIEWIDINKFKGVSSENIDIVFSEDTPKSHEPNEDELYETKEPSNHLDKPLLKCCSTETLMSSGYSSINSDIFVCLETNILKFSIDDENHGKGRVERFLDYHNDTEDVPLSIWIRDSLMHSINVQSRLVDMGLMDYFLNELQIYKYFDVFQRFVMLQDAQFASALVEKLGEEMHNVDQFNRSGIANIFKPSVLNSVLKFSLSTTSNNSSNFTSKLSFTIDDHPRKNASADIMSLLRLTLVVEWPACIVVQRKHLFAYDVLFAFIFKLKRVVWCVNDMFSRLKRDAIIFMGGRHHNEQFRHLHIFRHRMQHFVRALHDYVSDQVLTASWQKFHKRINQTTEETRTRNLDQLIDLHTKFVNECMSRCLLDEKTSSIMKVVDSIFDHVLLFHSLLKSESWITMEDGGPEGVFHPKFRLLFETHRKFEEASTFLEKMLVKLEQKTLTPHLLELLVRLKFN